MNYAFNIGLGKGKNLNLNQLTFEYRLAPKATFGYKARTKVVHIDFIYV
jgi:hypothetical protein